MLFSLDDRILLKNPASDRYACSSYFEGGNEQWK